jgi:hypothetical protein
MTDEIRDDLSTSHLSARRKIMLWASVGVVGAGAVAAGLLSQGGSHSAAASTIASAAETAASSAAPAPSGSAAPKPSAPAGKGNGRRGGGPGFAGGFGAFGGPGGPAGFGRTLHSEATVTTSGGGTEIVDTQAGKITGISGSTVTVTSTDKVAFTYTIGSTTRLLVMSAPAATSSAKPSGKPSVHVKATISDLKVGDSVEVVATRVGDVRTATSLTDGLPGTSAAGFAPRFGGTGAPGGLSGRGGMGGPAGSAAPSPVASPSTATGDAST